VKRFFLTTAIDFVNSVPHLGTAYEKVCADVIARFKRLAGYETHFLMGNDEHSQNVFKRAVEEGLSPLEYCDRMEQQFRRAWRHLDLSFDDFIRTTQPRHATGVTELIQRLYDAGDVYEGTYEGWYCVSCEEFKQEKDLIDGHCPVHPTIKPEWIREKNYFFRLSKYQRPLLEHFAAHPDFLQPEARRNEILRLVESGLNDISVSRAGQSWGIPLPFDPTSVVYVWFDALINYASAVGLGDASDEGRRLFATWWPADLHVIGKDITRFHTVIWPAMLMAARLPLPGRVFGHGFMTINGQRMSKSLGTIIDPVVAANHIGSGSPDPLRLYLIKEIPFGGDGDFSFERLDERYNADLANNLGNLVSRVSAMAGRYRQGVLRPAGGASEPLARLAEQSVADYERGMETLAMHEGAAAAFRLIDGTNEFIAATAPWTLAKDASQADRLTQTLFDAAEAVRLAGVMLLPIMPSSAREILRRIGADSEEYRLDKDGRWRNHGERTLLQEGPLWPRKETTTVSDHPLPPDGTAPGAHVPINVPGRAPAPAAGATNPPGVPPAPGTPNSAPGPLSPAPAPAVPTTDARISIDDFMKVELRTARVLAAERVEKSKKLLKLSVDLGTEQRTLVAGIAEAYEPETLVGKTVVVVFNLKPAKLMGIESNGMVLAASPEGGKPEVVTFANPPEPGTRVR
jgi:methionyl-tRNA synthetase